MTATAWTYPSPLTASRWLSSTQRREPHSRSGDQILLTRYLNQGNRDDLLVAAAIPSLCDCVSVCLTVTGAAHKSCCLCVWGLAGLCACF
jgi:hypothetical protein